MIEAHPTAFGRWFWTRVSAWGSKRAFHRLEVVNELAADPDRSILLLGNHISWWDGFWPLLLARDLFHKDYYVMMLEKELRKRPFMRQGGSFSIQPGSRSLITSLQYAARLLDNPSNLVVIYPQGAIKSVYDHEITFAPGILKVLSACKSKPMVVFSVAMIDFLSNPKPTVRFYLKEAPEDALTDQKQLQDAYRAFYKSCLDSQIAWANEQVHP